MSDLDPSNKGPATPAAGDPAASTPAPPAASAPAPAPAASAAPDVPAPVSAASRWTSLAIATGIVAVVGFLLARASESPAPPKPAREPPAVANRHDLLRPAANLPPSDRLRFMRALHGKGQGVPGFGPVPPAASMAAHDGQNPSLPTPPPQIQFMRPVIEGLRSQVQTCATKAQAAGQNVAPDATVTLNFTLHRDAAAGTSVQGAHLTSSNVHDPALEKCAIDAVTAANFPEQKGVGDLPVTLPFRLVPPAPKPTH